MKETWHKRIYWTALSFAGVLALLAIWAVWSYLQSDSAWHRDNEADTREQARLVRTRISGELDQLATAAHNVADKLSSENLDKEALKKLLRATIHRKPMLVRIGVAFEPFAFGPELRLYSVAYTRDASEHEALDVGEDYTHTDADWYQAPLKARTAGWVKPEINEAGKLTISYVLPFSRPTRRTNAVQLSGVVVATCAAADLIELLRGVDRVLVLLGNVGTPTAERTVPIVRDRRVLLFGAFTGAGFLRAASAGRYVINYRASYADETATIIQVLMERGVHPYEIGFFTQDDRYGTDGYRSAIAALRDRHEYDVADRLPHETYKRNTVNVTDAVLNMLYAETPPRAIVMVGTYAPSARFIELIHRRRPNTIFASVSFVGATRLARALGEDARNVVVTQVVPSFADETLPVVKEYRDDLAKLAPGSEPSFVSLEGYIAAKILVWGIERAKRPLTRESVIDGLLSLCGHNIGLGDDALVNYCGDPRKDSSHVWPTKLTKGSFVPLNWRDKEPGQGAAARQ